MPKGPEQRLSDKVRRSLSQAKGVYGIKLHGGMFGVAGLPDWCIVAKGRVLFVELKAPGQKPTKIQEHRIRQLRETQTPVVVCESFAAVQAEVMRHLGVEIY